MRCTFKTVFYVNGSKERNGIVPIMGRVTINGTIAQFSCKQSVTKAIWDAKGNRAIGKSKICLSFGHNEKRVVPWRLCASCHLGEPPQCFQWY